MWCDRSHGTVRRNQRRRNHTDRAADHASGNSVREPAASAGPAGKKHGSARHARSNMNVQKRPLRAPRAGKNQNNSEHAAKGQQNPANPRRHRGIAENGRESEGQQNQKYNSGNQMNDNRREIRHIGRRPRVHVRRGEKQDCEGQVNESLHVRNRARAHPSRFEARKMNRSSRAKKEVCGGHRGPSIVFLH
jgi:hypothetical protein